MSNDLPVLTVTWRQTRPSPIAKIKDIQVRDSNVSVASKDTLFPGNIKFRLDPLPPGHHRVFLVADIDAAKTSGLPDHIGFFAPELTVVSRWSFQEPIPGIIALVTVILGAFIGGYSQYKVHIKKQEKSLKIERLNNEYNHCNFFMNEVCKNERILNMQLPNNLEQSFYSQIIEGKALPRDYSWSPDYGLLTTHYEKVREYNTSLPPGFKEEDVKQFHAGVGANLVRELMESTEKLKADCLQWGENLSSRTS